MSVIYHNNNNSTSNSTITRKRSLEVTLTTSATF